MKYKYSDIEKVVAETLEVVSVIGCDLYDEELFNRIVYYTFHRMKKWEEINEKTGNFANSEKSKKTPECGYSRLS